MPIKMKTLSSAKDESVGGCNDGDKPQKIGIFNVAMLRIGICVSLVSAVDFYCVYLFLRFRSPGFPSSFRFDVPSACLFVHAIAIMYRLDCPGTNIPS